MIRWRDGGGRRTLLALVGNPPAMIGLAILAVTLVAAASVPLLPLPDPLEQDITRRLRPPFWGAQGTLNHPLGTDQVGRDVLTRIVWGARLTLPLSLMAATVSAIYGTVLGLVAAYAGGWVDSLIMRTADTQFAFPFIVIAIAIIAVVGTSIPTLAVTLSLWGWVSYARVARGDALATREREYVWAAVAIGAAPPRVLFRHILPNVLSPLIVIWTFTIAQIVLLESGLSFLGLGVQPPAPSWGNMLADGRSHISNAWWLGTFPGVAIMLSVLAVNLVGDAVRDILDPRFKT
ncbi:MAG: ABC transporter permease [Armatimonadetes bacterium]|nr:ABC transporter permease [Armatimonadota bacterium]